MQVHASPSREFVRFEKQVYFLHVPGNVDQLFCCWCIAAGGSKTTKNWFSLQSGPVRRLFQRCAANTSSRRASNITPRLTSRTAPSRVGPTFKFVNKMETKFLEP